MFRANHFLFAVESGLDISIANWLNVGVKLLLRTDGLASVISEGALEVYYPLVIATALVMPTVVGRGQSFLLCVEV